MIIKISPYPSLLKRGTKSKKTHSIKRRPISLKPFRRDVFPTIWSKLESMIKNGELIAPLEVYGEIEAGKDKTYDWCKSNKVMLKDVDECQIQKLQEVKNRYDKSYWENEINKPKWADPWVIALSICEEAIVVADEKKYTK